MSLRTRFTILLALLGLAVVANLGLAVWSVGLLDRQQSWANEQIGRVLGPLHRINRVVWTQSQVLGKPGFGFYEGVVAPDTEEVAGAGGELDERERILRLGASAIKEVEDLEEFFQDAVGAGTNTIRNLRERLGRAETASLVWADSRAEPDRRVALRELYELHELIERFEARLVQDAQTAAVYSADARPRLTFTVVTAGTMVVLLLFMAGSLFRRWVLLKAERLRVAAEHLGRGEFEYRVALEGNDELDRVGQQVNEMAETIEVMQAERIERERLAAIGEMSRRVAHNIRNPLAGIRSLAELSLVESPADSPVADHQRRILNTVDRFGQWLTELLSVSTPMEVSPSVQPIRPWLTGLVEALRPMAEARRVELVLTDADAPEEASIDRRHLEQAVSAVVSNALEISPAGGLVAVGIETRDCGSWTITVEDQGPGLSPEAEGKLFRPYFTTKPGGTGIGLAIAHRVVREHGGQLTAENRSETPGNADFGPGAVFRIEIPLAQVE
jgi:signal transduction histidine kinase